MVISKKTNKKIDCLQQAFKLKGNKADILGSTLAIFKSPNWNKCRSMSPKKYLGKAFENVGKRLEEMNMILP